MLEKKIEQLGDYFDGLNKLPEGYIAIKVIFPGAWTLYEKEIDENKENDFSITTIKKTEDGVDKTIFVGSPNSKPTDIIDFILKTIQKNVEYEEKVSLFKLKQQELAKLFDDNELSLLKTLTFKFDKQKKKQDSINGNEVENNTSN